MCYKYATQVEQYIYSHGKITKYMYSLLCKIKAIIIDENVTAF